MTEYENQVIALLQQILAELQQKLARQQDHLVVWPQIAPSPKIGPWAGGECCHVCGLKFEGAMGYVCNHHDCPSRVTCGVTAPRLPECL